MAFTLTAYNTEILEVMVSANKDSGIIWNPYVATAKTNGLNYELDYAAASATYFYYPNSAVNWGTSSASPSTNVIMVTAFNDTAILFISASDSTNELASVSFLPYYLDQFTISSTQLSASLSTFHIQVSTGEYLAISNDTKVLWNFAPERDG
ncbi:MAG: hypothetical protein WC905_05245, partial [Patescibacteria group bacterium]